MKRHVGQNSLSIRKRNAATARVGAGSAATADYPVRMAGAMPADMTAHYDPEIYQWFSGPL